MRWIFFTFQCSPFFSQCPPFKLAEHPNHQRRSRGKARCAPAKKATPAKKAAPAKMAASKEASIVSSTSPLQVSPDHDLWQTIVQQKFDGNETLARDTLAPRRGYLIVDQMYSTHKDDFVTHVNSNTLTTIGISHGNRVILKYQKNEASCVCYEDDACQESNVRISGAVSKKLMLHPGAVVDMVPCE